MKTGSNRRSPNVVVIVVHDLGTYLGSCGYHVNSPNLDQLAEEGVRFEHNFCTSPFCSPARGSIITGQYPHTNGLMGLVNLGWDLPEETLTDAEIFKNAGYLTCLVGFQHEKRSAADLKFEISHSRFITGSNYNTDFVADQTTDLLGMLAAQRDAGTEQRPFYLRIGTYSVHRNQFQISGDYGYDLMCERGVAEDELEMLPGWMDTPGLRKDLSGFTGDVTNMDRGVGTILKTLRDNGFDEDTLVVFTTDHGIDFPRAKGTLYDMGTHTALLMRFPGRIKPGTVVSGLSSHVDVLPTILDICGSPGSAPAQGISLLPLINGTRDAVRDEVFSEENSYPKNLMRAMRTERFKLIRNFNTGRRSDCITCGNGRIEAGTEDFYFSEKPKYELYDLHDDPHEMNNLIIDPDHQTIAQALKERLEGWMRETDDPILTGAIKRPEDEFERFSKAHPRAVNEHSKDVWI